MHCRCFKIEILVRCLCVEKMLCFFFLCAFVVAGTTWMTAWGPTSLSGSKRRPLPVPVFFLQLVLCRWASQWLLFLKWSCCHYRSQKKHMPLSADPAALQTSLVPVVRGHWRWDQRDLRHYIETVHQEEGDAKHTSWFGFSFVIKSYFFLQFSTLILFQPNCEHLEREVEKRKVFLAEAKLKAKGLNPDGTPALTSAGGFSPASKPSSPNVIKVEEKSPNAQTFKTVKKETDSRNQGSKSPHNG